MFCVWSAYYSGRCHYLLIGRSLGDDNITKNKEISENENERECQTKELEGLMVNFFQMLTREIEIRNQIHEERRLESEQNAYMDKMFMCDFVFSNL